MKGSAWQVNPCNFSDPGYNLINQHTHALKYFSLPLLSARVLPHLVPGIHIDIDALSLNPSLAPPGDTVHQHQAGVDLSGPRHNLKFATRRARADDLLRKIRRINAAGFIGMNKNPAAFSIAGV